MDNLTSMNSLDAIDATNAIGTARVFKGAGPRADRSRIQPYQQGLNPEMDAIIAMATAHDPLQRYPACREFLAALMAYERKFMGSH
jgi:hypothetical protein